jgi:hypothetical protein
MTDKEANMNMDLKRWATASIAVVVVIGVLEMIIHGVLLAPIYRETAPVWRPMSEMQQLGPLMWLGYAIFAPFFVWIYAKGWEPNKGAPGQGLRFGLMFGTGLSAMSSLVWYSVLPIPAGLAAAWFVAGVVEFVAAGEAAALLYREPKIRGRR